MVVAVVVVVVVIVVVVVVMVVVVGKQTNGTSDKNALFRNLQRNTLFLFL